MIDRKSRPQKVSAAMFASYQAARRVRDWRIEAKLNPPTPCKGRFPFPHLTVAELDALCPN